METTRDRQKGHEWPRVIDVHQEQRVIIMMNKCMKNVLFETLGPGIDVDIS